MDLVDGLRVFVAAVETGSLSGAGARAGISAKLASKYLAELEARLGVGLLHRTTRKLGLTAAGAQVYARAPEWLDALETMIGDLREAERGLSGRLRVSAPVTFGELCLQPLLREFRAPHPALEIDLRLSDQFTDLAAEGIDLAIRIGKLDDSALIARKIGSSAILLVASPAYLVRAGTPDQLEALADHACIRDTNMRGDGAWQLYEGAALRRVTVRGPFLANSARMVRDLALEGEGVALCPDYVVRADLAQGRLIHVLPDLRGPSLDIHALHLSQRRLSRRARALLEFLAATPLA